MYKRRINIEERFNVDIVEVVGPDNSAPIRTAILSNDTSAFDVFIARCPDALTFWQEGIAVSYEEIPNIDLSKPYWSQSMNKALSLSGHQYIALGDFNLITYDLTHALLFNKTMIKDLGLETPYDIVNSGKWTFAKMEEMMKAALSDLNGDGVMDSNDRWGYLATPKEVLPSFWLSAGEYAVNKDSNDVPYLAMGNERFMNVFLKTFEILYDSEAYFSKGTHDKDVSTQSINMFSNSQSLFMDCTFYVIGEMRNAEAEFGIIPYPKYDDAQQDYFSRVEYYYTVSVPVMNQNLDRVGVLLEAFNSESAKTVIPAYYDVALKTKYARDDESASMLDLIFKTRIIDIGDTTLCDKIRDNFVATMFAGNKRDLASQLERTQKVIDTFISKIPE